MEQLIELLREGVSAAHTIEYMKQRLSKCGFETLGLQNEWILKEQGKYYVDLYGTNGIAFLIGKNIDKDVRIRVGLAHSDTPCFQIKPNMKLNGNNCTRWNVEIYGGMNQKSWFDRPLGVAGQVVIAGEDSFSPKTLLYKSTKALAIIPSLAIHMDRELNKKGTLDVAKELVPIAGLSGDFDLLDVIASELSLDKEAIIDYDLFLYNMQSPELVGLDASMICAPKLDNLTSVGAMLSSFSKMATAPDNTIDIMVVYDNEEVGSLSKQGADSSLLALIVERIGRCLQSTFDISRCLTNGFMLSIDVAHASHPNYEEKSDATNKVCMSQGFSIKRSVGQKYGTSASSCAVIKQLADKNHIPYTIAINKTGVAGGSTLGPIATAYLPIPCADIGMPILSMHSACELGAVNDYASLKNIVNSFFTE